MKNTITIDLDVVIQHLKKLGINNPDEAISACTWTNSLIDVLEDTHQVETLLIKLMKEGT